MLVPAAAVGAVGVPVKEGEAIVALKAMSLIFVVILAVFAATFVCSEVILAVLLATVVCRDAMFEVLVEILFALVVILLELVIMFAVLVAILAVFAVMLAVFEIIFESKVVILAVLEAIKVGKLPIVDALIPPTFTTVGAAAVPPKSFVNCNLPFVVASASGVAEPPTIEVTKAVVAICVVLVPGAAVGAVGVPVKEGEAIVALNAMSFVLDVILAVFDVILLVLVVIAAVFAVMLAVFAATLD